MNPYNALPNRGYRQLARFMVARGHVMLKQYRDLAVQDLLYLQAELCDLQYDHAQQALADSQQQDFRRVYDREWWHLQSDVSRGGDGKQWQLALQIRSKLREYYAAIKQYEAIEAMRRPSEHQRNMVCTFIQSESVGGDCHFMGRDLGDLPPFPTVFSSFGRPDLVFIGEDTGEDDLLSRLFRGPGMRLFHRLWKPLKKPTSRDEGDGAEGEGNATTFYYYSGRKLRLALDIIGSAVSSIIPIVSIIALFFVHDVLRRLALVCVFSFLFSVFMSVATRARRIEVFGATAAFASVQVVFIGTTST